MCSSILSTRTQYGASVQLYCKALNTCNALVIVRCHQEHDVESRAIVMSGDVTELLLTSQLLSLSMEGGYLREKIRS